MNPDGTRSIIFDTDIGSDIDDAYALAFILSCHELRLEAVTVVSGDVNQRAQIAAKLLHLAGRDDVPVALGVANEKDVNQAPWAEGFDSEADPRPAPELLVELISARPGEITLVPVGPLSNVAAALELRPELAQEVAQIVLMGGGVYTGYRSSLQPCPEYNIRADVAASQKVFESGASIVMAGLEATAVLQLERHRQERMARCGLPLTTALGELLELWPGGTPTLFDPMAVALVLDETICDLEPACVRVDDEGLTVLCDGEPMPLRQGYGAQACRLALRPSLHRFFGLYMSKLLAGAA